MPGDESGADGGVDFSEFCDARYRELRRAFGRARGVGLEPSEIVHETLLIAARRYHEFASDDELVVWCKVVGTNLINRLAEVAQRQRRRLHLAVVPDELLVDAEDRAVDAADLTRAVAKLPKRQQKALQLSALGYHDDEIGDILNLNAVAVRQLLSRARKSARKRLGELVAGFLPGTRCWIHKAPRAVSPTSQAMVASVVTMSVVAALVFPSVVALPKAPTKLVGGEAAPVWKVAAGNASATHRPTYLPASHLLPAVAGTADRNGPQRRKHYPVPNVTETCGPGICVGVSCPDSGAHSGDRLYLKLTGPCGYHVTEGVTPLCDVVPDNPAIGCQRDSDPAWKVDPPPTKGPIGGPL